MLVSKLYTQKVIDAGKNPPLAHASLVVLVCYHDQFLFLKTGVYLLVAVF